MNSHPRVMIIDDEESIRFAFGRYFEARGAEVLAAASGREGIDRYAESRPEVVFLDVRLGDMNGLDVLDAIRQHDPDAIVIVVTAYGSLETVTRAMRNKAFEFLVKPLDLDRAAALVEQARSFREAAGRLAAAGAGDAADDAEATRIVGRSAAMQAVYKSIAKAALSDATVLILGETGTGKEVVARAIHDSGPRREQPFVAVNCGALPENLVESELFGYVRGAFTGADADKVGRFESAQGGTIMLDEVGELPQAAQVKLLRFLDTHAIERLGSVEPTELDVRVIAATNRDLAEGVSAGSFREDLFYRLAVLQIDLPPLAARREDVLPLARHFLRQLTAERRDVPLSDEAAAALEHYDWPGNVRELRNAMEHAHTLCGGGPVLASHLPDRVRGGPRRQGAGRDPASLVERYLDALDASAESDLHRAAIEPVERAVIRRSLEATGGNQSEAATRLGLHRNTLRSKIRQYGLDPGTHNG